MRKEYIEPIIITDMFEDEDIITSSNTYENKLRNNMNVSEDALTEVEFNDLDFLDITF